MFRPGNIGHLGRLGLVAASRPGLVAQALAILAKYGSAANLYLPGVGAISSITAGNWLDNIGTTAATVDNPVGLVVSAGKAVGQEFFTDADATLTGEAVRLSPNLYRVLSTTGSNSAVGKTGMTPGRTYRVLFDIKSISVAGAGVAVDSNGTSVGVFTTVGIKSVIYTAPGTGAFSIKRQSGATDITIGDISVRELPGAHLTQVTAANRPILRLSGGVYAWDFVSSDSLTSTMTPGNAGFFCASANVTDSGVLRTLLGAGAGSDASSGVWLARNASNALTLQVGNGTTRNSVSAAYPVATNAVASAGWDSSAMFVGINGTETSGAKSVDCTSSNTMNLGVLTGTTNPMLGTIGATILMPTVLPIASERATLRQFVASLSGVTI